MTAAITPVSQATAALPVRPVAGERVMMDGGTAPLATILQNLYDRTEHAKDATQTAISWSGDFAVSGSAPNNISISVGAINSMVVNNGTALKALAAAAATITQTKIEGGGGTLTAAAQWWYVYAFNNAGTLDYQISLTVPNSSRTTKNGDSAYRYLGCFKTLSTGVPITCRASRGRYLYRASNQAVADLLVLTSGSATGYTTVPLAALVPPHARLAKLRGDLVNSTGGGIYFASIQTDGDAGAMTGMQMGVAAAAGLTTIAQFDIETDSNQDVQYLVTSANADLELYVLGWYE